MSQEKLNEVIQFAIDREMEAAAFYRELQDKVHIPASKEILKNFENMELAHAETLKKIDVKKIEYYYIPKVTNLKLSDYMVDPVVHEEMTFQDVLLTAMKREEAATKLYNELAADAENDQVKQLFLKLASEEAKHKLQLETIYDDEINVEF